MRVRSRTRHYYENLFLLHHHDTRLLSSCQGVLQDFFLAQGGKMNLRDRIRELANAKGMSLPKLESELGFGNSTIVKWDKSTPNVNKLIKVADYFGVSLDYLMMGEQETTLTPKDERDIKKDLESIMEKLVNKEDGPAAFDGNEIPDEDVEMFAGQVEIMLRRLKAINKEKYNPYKNKR